MKAQPETNWQDEFEKINKEMMWVPLDEVDSVKFFFANLLTRLAEGMIKFTEHDPVPYITVESEIRAAQRSYLKDNWGIELK